ncbi:MAG: int [Actinomycetia bacterium]|nr:int [Actinomycetes bacterium]
MDGSSVAAVLAGQAEPHLRPSTAHGYRDHIDRYLIPSIGRITLADLTGKRLQACFTLLSRQRTRNGTPIAASTVDRVRATLRSALNAAVREDLIASNPLAQVRLDKPVRPHPVIWTDERAEAWRRDGIRPPVAVWTLRQLITFLSGVENDRLAALWWLIALRGLRRGEAAALDRDDLDSEARELTISGSSSRCRASCTAGRRRAAPVSGRSPWTRPAPAGWSTRPSSRPSSCSGTSSPSSAAATPAPAPARAGGGGGRCSPMRTGGLSGRSTSRTGSPVHAVGPRGRASRLTKYCQVSAEMYLRWTSNRPRLLRPPAGGTGQSHGGRQDRRGPASETARAAAERTASLLVPARHLATGGKPAARRQESGRPRLRFPGRAPG